MMDGSYFDRLAVGEIKQQGDGRIADASRELKENAAQQRRKNMRLIPQKGKMISANKKWTSARNDKGRSKINAVTLDQISLCLGC